MTLALLLVSLFFAFAFAISLFVVVFLLVREQWLLRLSPERRTSFYRAALLAPFAGAALGMLAVLAPSFLELAGATGHCDVIAGHHVHLCFLHFSASAGLPIAVVGSFVLLLATARARRSFRAWVRERRAVTSLVRTGRPQRNESGVVEFDSEIPICVTLGLRKPSVFLSSAAVRALGTSGLAAALEHERAHMVRGDDFALFVGRIAALFHLPWFGPRLLARWQQESEIVCDAFAARRTGSPVDLAGAIVKFHRALLEFRAAVPCPGACFCQTSPAVLERRVRALLEASSEEEEDNGRFALLAGLLLLGIGLALQAFDLHHAMESALGVLGVIH